MKVTIYFQSTGAVPAGAQPFRMVGGSMTVGRSDVNDLVLPDPEKTISSRHCAIEDQNGNLVVIDFSTNGTFLNYGKMALGQTPTPLNNGDILSIGPYELLVEVASVAQDAAPLADPLPEAGLGPGRADDLEGFTDPLETAAGETDFLDELLGAETAGPSSVQRDRLGDDGLMPPLDEDDAFLGKPPVEHEGPAQSIGGSALSDRMETPAPATSQIPDDWDLDLDLPEEAAPPPVAAAPEPEDPFAPEAPGATIPEDDDPFTLDPPAPETPAEMEPDPFVTDPGRPPEGEATVLPPGMGGGTPRE